MSKYTIIQQEAYPNPDYNKWMVIDGQRGPSGNPVGAYTVLVKDLQIDRARNIAARLNAGSLTRADI